MNARSRRPEPRPPAAMSRRSALAGLGAATLGLLVTGCTDPSTDSQGEPTRGSDRGDGSPPAARGRDAPEPVTVPALSPWTPGPGEVRPEIKVVAARLLEAAGTWDRGGSGNDAAASRLSAAGFDPDLLAQLSPLLDTGGERATVNILYPQYGGLEAASASVMVALDQALALPDGTSTRRGMTLDVRLSSTSSGWVVTTVDPDQPPAGPGAPSALGERVLSEPRVVLPADALADVQTGVVHDSVLAVLEGLAQDHIIDVSTFSAGHPVNIFGTDRQSNHSRGRAVDIWRIDGALVVDPSTSRDLLAEVMMKAGKLGATEIGGPFDVNGDRPRYFTDDLHKDHLHIGVTEGRSPAVP